MSYYDLTEEQLRDYIAKPSSCPWCGSDNIEASRLDADDNYASCSVRCDGCEREWEDIYRVVGIYTPDTQEHRYPPEADPGNDERLLAAAPELLAALKAIVARIEGVWDDPDLMAYGPLDINSDRDVMAIAQQAIAKARR